MDNILPEQTLDNPNPEPEFNERECRKTFSRIGFSYFIFELLFAGMGYLLLYIFSRNFTDLIRRHELVRWLVNYLPMYFIALPLTALLLKKLPAVKPEKHRLSAGKFCILFLIGWGLTMAGNIIGNIFSAFIDSITGLETSNTLDSLLFDTNPLIIIFFVIIMAPIVEEILCRKLIVDHTLKYGEWTAILLSGLIFGLIHGNFFQFFYAFALGMLMAYIYVKTGRLRYTIIFHMLINTVGSLISILLMRSIGINPDGLSQLGQEYIDIMLSHIPQVIMLIFYVFIEWSAAIAGIVLFIIFISRIIKTVKPMNIPKGKRIKCIFINPGMILFFIIIIADFVTYLIL